MILQPKMRVVLNRFDPTDYPQGRAGHIVRIGDSAGVSGVPLVQFDDGDLAWVDPNCLELEPPRVVAMPGTTPQAIAEAARDQIGAALKLGEDDAKRLEWLEEIAGFTYIMIESGPAGARLVLRSQETETVEFDTCHRNLREAIDVARRDYNPEN